MIRTELHNTLGTITSSGKNLNLKTIDYIVSEASKDIAERLIEGSEYQFKEYNFAEDGPLNSKGFSEMLLRECIVPAGLVLVGKHNLNLLPHEALREAEKAKIRKKIYVFGGIIGAVLLVIVAALFVINYKQSVVERRNAKMIRAMKPQIQQLGKLTGNCQ